MNDQVEKVEVDKLAPAEENSGCSTVPPAEEKSSPLQCETLGALIESSKRLRSLLLRSDENNRELMGTLFTAVDALATVTEGSADSSKALASASRTVMHLCQRISELEQQVRDLVLAGVLQNSYSLP